MKKELFKNLSDRELNEIINTGSLKIEPDNAKIERDNRKQENLKYENKYFISTSPRKLTYLTKTYSFTEKEGLWGCEPTVFYGLPIETIVFHKNYIPTKDNDLRIEYRTYYEERFITEDYDKYFQYCKPIDEKTWNEYLEKYYTIENIFNNGIIKDEWNETMDSILE